jgi:hypothetical protein
MYLAGEIVLLEFAMFEILELIVEFLWVELQVFGAFKTRLELLQEPATEIVSSHPRRLKAVEMGKRFRASSEL